MKLTSVRELKIAGSKWKVTWCPTLLGDTNMYGVTKPADREILMAMDQHPDAKLTTLFHEGLHACLTMSSSHGLDHDTEERVIRALELPGLSLFRDNKQVWA